MTDMTGAGAQTGDTRTNGKSIGTANGTNDGDGTPIKTISSKTLSWRRGRNRTGGADQCLTLEQVQELRKKASSKDKASDEIAEELSAALGLAERIRSQDLYIPGAFDHVVFIFDCLLAEPPRLILARDERLRMQVEVYRQSGFISRLLANISSGSPVGLVLAALLASLILWGIFVLVIFGSSGVFSRPPFDKFFFMNGTLLAVITSAAYVGGVVSIATRLHEFSRVRDLDPFAMFWTAMLKPLIGVVLSVFVLTTLVGGIITFSFLPDTELTPKAGKGLYILWMIGFLCGFSERFAWDFVDRAQGMGSAPTNPKNSG